MATKGEPSEPVSLSRRVEGKWQSGWFVLETNCARILYYKSRDTCTTQPPSGKIELSAALIMSDRNDDVTFYVDSKGKQHAFQAKDNKEREKWVTAIDEAIQHQTGNSSAQSIKSSAMAITSNGTSTNTTKLIGELKTTSRDSFDSIDGQEEFFDAVSVPIILCTQDSTSSSKSDLSYSPVLHHQNPSSLLTNSNPPRRAISTMNIGKDYSGQSVKDQRRSSVLSDTAKLEEEVYVPSPITMVSVEARQKSPDVMEDDYEQEADLAETANDHKSIILHVLSQLRPGVDLTRITLPAFILERRSHLEATADMFGHADFFARIPLFPDPKDRLTEVVRFLISSLSSGRKGTLAKKPYNPILGEVFQCYYDLPAESEPEKEETETEQELVTNGPIPWSNYGSVTFISEQVSHHPPITAFYSECPATGIHMTGYAQFKSKFMGLSVQVQNIGVLSINVPQYNEEYRTTLPNAYGRSVLTVPWMEIGGKIVVHCQQSDYHANLEFHQKPFYGGRKHRVTAELYAPKQKKPFMKLDGEWNNIVNSKTPGEAQKLFFDAQNTPVYKKKIKKLEVMAENESRKVWFDVTGALKEGDEQAAGDAKHEVEQAQREKVKTRKDRGVEWVPKLFRLVDDTRYVYDNTLVHRNPALLKK